MVEYLVGGEADLPRIEGLWEQLRSMLADVATTFRHQYRDITFTERMEVVRRRAAGGSLMMVLAVEDGQDIGYCLSTIGEDGSGWVDSFFVVPHRRGEGVGGELLERSIAWLQGQEVANIRLTVTPGNEDVMSFYQSRGFVLRKYLLEHTEKNE